MLKSLDFWDLTVCRWVCSSSCFEGLLWFHFQGKSSILLWTVWPWTCRHLDSLKHSELQYIPSNTASHSTRIESLPWYLSWPLPFKLSMFSSCLELQEMWWISCHCQLLVVSWQLIMLAFNVTVLMNSSIKGESVLCRSMWRSLLIMNIVRKEVDVYRVPQLILLYVMFVRRNSQTVQSLLDTDANILMTNVTDVTSVGRTFQMSTILLVTAVFTQVILLSNVKSVVGDFHRMAILMIIDALIQEKNSSYVRCVVRASLRAGILQNTAVLTPELSR